MPITSLTPYKTSRNQGAGNFGQLVPMSMFKAGGNLQWFNDDKFHIGGYGVTRGFFSRKFYENERKWFFEVPFPPSKFYRLEFSQKFVYMTGKPLPAWAKKYEKQINLFGPFLLGGTESILKSTLGYTDPTELTGVITAKKVRHTPAALFRALMWGKGQLRLPETYWCRLFNGTTYTLFRPAFIQLLVSYVVSDPEGWTAKVVAFGFKYTLDWMHEKTENFFDPPLHDRKEIPPPPPLPPPPTTPPSPPLRTVNGSEDGSKSNRREVPFAKTPDPRMQSRLDGLTAYQRFPPHLIRIREGLRALGMTWSGATMFLQGMEVSGNDLEIVKWIAGMVKIECQVCNLIWFVPEETLHLYVLHFFSQQLTVAWCKRCGQFTHVNLSRMGGMWISQPALSGRA